MLQIMHDWGKQSVIICGTNWRLSQNDQEDVKAINIKKRPYTGRFPYQYTVQKKNWTFLSIAVFAAENKLGL